MGDITFTFRGKKYEYFLYKDPQTGQKSFKAADAKILPPMQTTDRPLNAHIPPLREDLITQDYFNAGSGEILFEHGKRVYNSPGVDTRTVGRARLSPSISKATINSLSAATITLTNAGFETGDTTGWTDLDGVTATSHTDNWGGEEALAGLATEIFYQNLTFDAAWKGHGVKLSAYVRRSAATAEAQIGFSFDGGSTYVWGYEVGCTAAYQELTCSCVIPLTATDVWICARSEETSGGANSVYWDDFTIVDYEVTGGAVVAFEDYNGYPYAAYGTALIKYDGTDWDTVATFPAAITDLASFAGKLYIAIGYANAYWYYDGTNIIQSTVTNGNAQFFSAVGTKLWENSSAYQVRSSTNPANGGSWTTTTDVGDSSLVITNLVNHPDTVTVNTTSGFFEITATGTVDSLMPDLYRGAHSKTGRSTCLWRGNFYISSGYNVLYEFNYGDNAISVVSPKDAFPTQSTFAGYPMSMDGDDEYLYVCVDNGTKVELLAAHWATIIDKDGNPSTAFWWHHLLEQTLTAASDNVRAARMSPYPSARVLWLGCADTTDGIYGVTVDGNMGLAGDLVTSWHKGKYEYILKTFYSITLYTENCAAAKTIQVLYKKEFETSFTSIGTITSNSATTLYFPADVTTKKIQLKFTFASDSATTSPHLLGYTLRCTARPFDLEEGRITINENLEFSSFGGLETCWIHPEFRNIDKSWYSIAFITEGLSSTKYITFQYKLDDETTYTTHDTLIDDSPYQFVYFPEETVGKQLDVKFTLSSPSDTSLIAYIVNGTLRPEKRKEIDFSVYLANKQPLDGGGFALQDADALASILRELDDYAWPVKMKCPTGESYDVTIQSITEQIAIDPQNKRKEYLFTIKALEAV